jgi:hypothetical protein
MLSSFSCRITANVQPSVSILLFSPLGVYNFYFGLVEINVVVITIIIQLTHDFQPPFGFTAVASDITGMYEFL